MISGKKAKTNKQTNTKNKKQKIRKKNKKELQADKSDATKTNQESYFVYRNDPLILNEVGPTEIYNP